MRYLVGLIIVAFLAYSGWWWLGSTAHERGVELWLDDRRAAGWIADYDTLSVAGYPNRIDTTVTALDLADPRSGWAWSAPFLQVASLSYKPNHVIVTLPDAQRISSLQTTYNITSEIMRGSIVFVPNTDLTLDRLRLELKNIAVATDQGTATLSAGNFATNRMTEGSAPDFAHEIGLDITDLSVPERILRMIDPGKRLPQVMETTHIDVVAAFDKPWDRLSIEGRKPQLTALRLRDVNAVWGQMMLQAQGRAQVDRDGFLNGEITVRARNWRAMIDLLEDASVIPRDMARTLKRGLGLMAGLGGGDDLQVPLTFSDGGTYLGPIPLGPAPRIEIK